jgi:hypothetical protein
MRSWPVPIQITEDEKAIGKISFKQAAWLGLFFCTGGAAGILLPISIPVRFSVFVIIVCLGCVVAFGELWNIKADKLIFMWLKWRLKPRTLFLRGDE